MKNTILIILILTGICYSQVIGTTTTGRLFQKKSEIKKVNNTPPQITIISPVLDANDGLKTEINRVHLQGKATAEIGIKSFAINNKVMDVSLSGEFSVYFDLKPGLNQFDLITTSNADITSTKSIKITYSIADKLGPAVVIIEPEIKDGEAYLHKEAFLTIRGKATDESGIKEIMVNNINSTLMSSGEFFANVKLTDGNNILIVKATDLKGNVSEKMMRVSYSSDLAGPVVTIIDPAITRGSRVISKNEIQIVRGVAIDNSGVIEVTINNRKATILPNGEFTIEMFLTPGDNQIVVRAVDSKMNATVDSFTITRKLEDLIAKGKYYAVIIGIDKYRGIWKPLKNAVNDAMAVEALMKSDYKFDEFYTLYNENATRKNILDLLDKVSGLVTKDDNVLIFYSGHGELNQKQNKGYWVPFDATTKSTADYISNSEIQNNLSAISSKHTLLISDACFSGDIFRGRTEELAFEQSEKYFKEVYRRPSRYGLTSGDIEPVTDGGKEGHSVFTYYLLKSLKGNQAKYFTAGQVFNEISIPVANNSEQTPVYNPIKNTGDEGGQFIFIRK